MDWNDEKLAELQAKYGSGHGGDIFNPDFRRVADRIFSASGTRAAPFAGVPTLLDAPFRQIDPANPDFGDLQVALVGMPMDLGVTNRPGSRFGPRALRTIERIGPYNHVLKCAPVHELKVADIGDVPFRTDDRLLADAQVLEELGFDVSPSIDPRAVPSEPANGPNPSRWRDLAPRRRRWSRSPSV